MAITVIAIAAVVGAGAAIYSASNQPDAPQIPPPPPPAGSEQYDDEGNLLTRQVWRPDKNAYITEYDPEPEWSDVVAKPNRPFFDVDGTVSRGGTDAEYQVVIDQWKKDAPESEAHKQWQARKNERIKDRQTW